MTPTSASDDQEVRDALVRWASLQAGAPRDAASLIEHVDVAYDFVGLLHTERLWSLARKSISDWKKVYLPECNGCGALDRRGGFFQSGMRVRSAQIHALPARENGLR